MAQLKHVISYFSQSEMHSIDFVQRMFTPRLGNLFGFQGSSEYFNVPEVFQCNSKSFH